ncbi:FAD/NAD(P)-binding protein [Curtobacterium sp. Leaf261]|uniref:FAD/NAD(P)-binding protein n=1 Tax=Curtobacterium sp. Leaf261 TaxID=1736311 RepID=UPI0006F65A17|nr:FAD/NAD(P)-binding protein [Curtobacterium sp. Leaf261]KQO60397.1 hypothetical protein ASF23_14390 [Curtobacterium sp. Leaf261]
MNGPGSSVVIVGGGASAVYVAVAVRERAAARGVDAPEITVVSREPAIGRGLAYGRAEPHHRLNSPAGKMSVSAADEQHFVRWCTERGLDVGPADFVFRNTYGDYVEDSFRALVADGAASAVHGEAVDLTTDDDGVHVVLDDGRTVDADVAVLALGNPPPARWATGAAAQVDDPWAVDALDEVPAGADVLLVGTGLTMVDVATTLARRDDGIRMTATSRHLLLPGVHPSAPAAPGPGLDPAAITLGDLAHDLGEQLRAADRDGTPWQAVVDGMRPHLMEHWAGLTEVERRRFLEHLARRWDVRRHRMAPSVHDELQSLVDAGTLRFDADADPADHEVVVFCTGPGSVTTPGWSPLVDALLAHGALVQEPLGLGLAAEHSGAVIDAAGTADGRLLAIGHALRGALWETTAIGEIRILANRVADRALETLTPADATETATATATA